jgi:hypothetical protein
MEATEPTQVVKAGLALLCVTLALMQTFACNRVSKMDPLELPLWFSTSRVPWFFVYGLAILFWPTFISGIVWSFVALRWWIALIIIAVSWILADTIEGKVPPMLTVLLTGLPSLLLAVIIWLV